jgi:hypothetical protein
VPGAAPVTSPLPLTVATSPSPDDHAMVRPLRTLPFESRSVTDNWTVPCVTTLAECGLTLTEATGGALTVTLVVPILPSLVARIAAEPIATAVTKPLLETVATDVLDDAQVMVRPPNAVPVESRGVAPMVAVSPGTREAVAGSIVTDATGAGSACTATRDTPLTPPVAAVMFALPPARAVTKPLLDTVATAVLSLVQLMIEPVNTSPSPSFTVAASCDVLPCVNDSDDGETDTLAAGASEIVIFTFVFLLPADAVTVVAPVATPVTSPALLTDASVGSADVHDTTADIVCPCESRTVALSCAVW